MPNLFEHFKASAAYVHIIFIKIVQASEMPNLFEHFKASAGQHISVDYSLLPVCDIFSWLAALTN